MHALSRSACLIFADRAALGNARQARILKHEDNEVMRSFQVLPASA